MGVPIRTTVGVTTIGVVVAFSYLLQSQLASSDSAVPAAAAEFAEALFVDRFSEGSIFPFEIDGSPKSVTVAPDPAGGTDRVARIGLERTDPINPSRTEIVPEHIPEFSEGYFAPFAKDVWYAFEMYLPTTFVPDDELETLFQFHDVAELPQIFGYPGPPLQVSIERDEWKLFAAWESRLIPLAADESNNYGGSRKAELGSALPDIGKWTSWVIHARWAYRGDQAGRMEIWKDGISVYAADGPNTYNDLRGGPYLKTGVYKWTWPNSQKSTTTSRHIFLRNVCIDFQKIDPAAAKCRRQAVDKSLVIPDIR